MRNKDSRLQLELVCNGIFPPAHGLEVGKFDQRQTQAEKEDGPHNICGQAIENLPGLRHFGQYGHRNGHRNHQHQELADCEVPELERLVEHDYFMDTRQERPLLALLKFNEVSILGFG